MNLQTRLQELLGQGIGVEAIRAMLLQEGFDEEEIADALDGVERDPADTPQPAPPDDEKSLIQRILGAIQSALTLQDASGLAPGESSTALLLPGGDDEVTDPEAPEAQARAAAEQAVSGLPEEIRDPAIDAILGISGFGQNVEQQQAVVLALQGYGLGITAYEQIDFAGMFDYILANASDIEGVGALFEDAAPISVLGGEVESEEAMKERIVTDFLLQQHQQAGPIFRSYGAANNILAAQGNVWGIEVQDLMRIQQLGYDDITGVQMGLLASAHGVDPYLGAAAWMNVQNAFESPAATMEWKNGMYLPKVAVENETWTPGGGVNYEAPLYGDATVAPEYRPDPGGEMAAIRRVQESGTTPGQFLRGFDIGMGMYDNPFIAAIHAVNPELAERVFREGPTLTAKEWANIENMIGNIDQYKTGNTVYDTRLEQIKKQIEKVALAEEGLPPGGSAPVFEVSEDAAREVGRALAGAWNLTMTDEEIAILGSTFGGAVRSAYMAAWQESMAAGSEGDPVAATSFNPSAYAAEYLRKLPEYLELFGEKHAAETEEEYVAKFEQMSQELLGYDDPDAVRAGMVSGSRDTVGQNAVLSGAAQGSSRWQERAAGLAEVFRSMT